MSFPRERITAITHGDRPFHNPLEPARVDGVLERLELPPGAHALDVGCGQGELLIRLAERHGATGLGIDASELAIAAAGDRADARAPRGAVELIAAPADSVEIEPGAFAVAACIGSSHALGGLEPALALLAGAAAPGGWVLIGEGFWEHEPGEPYLQALGATRDELTDLAGLVHAGDGLGLRCVHVTVADRYEWDRYEWELIFNGERYAAEHPDEPGVEDLLAWVDGARERVLAPGGRGTLGFGLVLWRRVAA